MSGGAPGGIALRYDRDEDRIVLTLDRADAPRQFWITRRQCAGLIKSLSPAARKAAAQTPLPRGRGPGAAAASPDGEAPQRAVITVRKSTRAIRLSFACGDAEAIVLDVDQTQFARLQGLLCRIASAAGWALEAAAPADNASPPRATLPQRRLH